MSPASRITALIGPHYAGSKARRVHRRAAGDAANPALFPSPAGRPAGKESIAARSDRERSSTTNDRQHKMARVALALRRPRSRIYADRPLWGDTSRSWRLLRQEILGSYLSFCVAGPNNI